VAELMAGRRLLLILAAFLLGAAPARAAIQRSLYRSPEALAMGGAYTAIVEGRDAPFYNPAGVAAIDSLSVHWATLDGTVSDWVISGWKTLSDLKNPSGSAVNTLMGENIFVDASASAAVLAPGLAVVALYDVQGALYAKNQSFPKIEYGYQTTSGVQAAWGMAVTDGKRRGHGRRNSEFLNEWKFGIGGKYLVRRGGFRLLTATELFGLTSMDASSLIGGKGTGYGLDLGVQRVQRLNPELSLHWGAAFLNAGDVQFGGGASPLMGDLSTGVAIEMKKDLAKITLAYDIQQANRADTFTKKQNFGARLSLPLLDFYAGLHQSFLTYGAAADIWLLRVSGAIYKEETGSYPKQDTEGRFAFRVDFKMDL
jgi:hypothetical protein